jgi:hypothetical protein
MMRTRGFVRAILSAARPLSVGERYLTEESMVHPDPASRSFSYLPMFDPRDQSPTKKFGSFARAALTSGWADSH